MAKDKSIKDKIKAKAKATKKKVKGKLKAPAAIMAAMLVTILAGGCSTATPASRSTTAQYRIEFSFDDSARNNTVTVTLGDGALASADSAGSTETQTATPTVDVKPDVNLNYAQGGGITNRGTGGGSAGILESLTADSLKLLKSYVAGKKSGTVTLTKKDGTTVTADCKDGECTFSDGTKVNAETCADCELPGWVEPDPVP